MISVNKNAPRQGVTLGHTEAASSTPAPTGTENRVAIITNPKALTFPLVVAIVKTAWEGLKMLPVESLSSIWVPFILTMALGFIITIYNLSEEKPSTGGWVTGITLGLVQSIMLFSAVMGITNNPA